MAASGAGAESDLFQQTMQDLVAETQNFFQEYWTAKEAEKAAQKAEAAAAKAASSAASGAGASGEAASGTEADPIKRKDDIQEKRAPQEQQWETGYRRFQQEVVAADMQIAPERVEELSKVVGQWQHARRVGISDFRNPEFIKWANRRSIACVKFVLRGDRLETTHARLIEQLPQRFLSASGDPRMALKDMVESHDGELREISGAWEWRPGLVPTMQDEPSFYHCQFARNRSDYLSWQDKGRGYARQQVLPGPGELVNAILKMPASGGSMGGFGEEHYFVRRATIVGMGELLWFFGEHFTAAELYAYFECSQIDLEEARLWELRSLKE